MNDCIFCKIIDRNSPANIVYENQNMLIIHDINPQADVHLLIMPKMHIATMFEINDDHESLIGKMIVKATELAKEFNFSGYKLLINTGKTGGQIVFHIHIHLLGYY